MTKLTAKSISQHKLRRLAELMAAADELEVLKAELKGMVDAKLPCQPGRYSLKVTSKKGSRRPAWKDEYVDLATEVEGPEKAEQMVKNIIDNTEPGAPSKSLILVDRENPEA